MMQLQKHMFSDMEWYDWLTGQVATVGWCYGLAVGLKAVLSKIANKFNILNCRPANFGMGNDYGFLYKVMYQLVMIVSWRSMAAFLGWGNAITFKWDISCKK